MVGKTRKSVEDAKVAGVEKGKRNALPLSSFVPIFVFFFFLCSHFLNSADPTILEPVTG